MRRWRGTINVPLTEKGRIQAMRLQHKLHLDAIYHDNLSRCAETARLLRPNVLFEDEGPRPWNMGELFEGREITEESLEMAKWFIHGNPEGLPPRGEKFRDWAQHWMGWITTLKTGFAAVGVVTHNRNIQYLLSHYQGKFIPHMYDCVGPDYCSVYYYRDGEIVPWGGKNVPRGIYLVRHGETEFGT